MIAKTCFYISLVLVLFLSACKNEYAAIHHSPLPIETISDTTIHDSPSEIDFILNRLSFLSNDSTILSQLSFNATTITWLSPIDTLMYSFSIDTLATLNPNEKTAYISTKLGFETPNTQTTLTGLKIALDPGHSSGDFESAKIEGKFLELLASKNPTLMSDTKLIESELTFHTALVLKKQLEKYGAKVMLTRTEFGKSAMGYDFNYWFKNLFQQHLDSLYAVKEINTEEYDRFKKLKKNNSDYAQKVIFNKLFNRLDFETRANKINAFLPDLTLILHYNVDIKNDPWEKPTYENKAMAFAPGGFMQEETSKPDDQFHFLRLLFSNQIEESISLSHCIIEELRKDSLITIAKPSDSISYLTNYCVPTDFEGVYCRNLALTRKVTSPVSYLEPLYQDNIHEHAALSKKNIPFDNFLISKRVEEIANAYYKGIIAYWELRNKKEE